MKYVEVEVVCPCCEGEYKERFNPRPYFKTAKEIGYVHCEWCMDTGKNKEMRELEV